MSWVHSRETQGTWEQWELQTDFGLVTVQRIHKATEWPPRIWKTYPKYARDVYAIFLEHDEADTLPLDTPIEDVLKVAPLLARMGANRE